MSVLSHENQTPSLVPAGPNIYIFGPFNNNYKYLSVAEIFGSLETELFVLYILSHCCFAFHALYKGGIKYAFDPQAI